MIYLFYRVITSEIYELTLVGLPGGSHQNGRDSLSNQIISKFGTEGSTFALLVCLTMLS